MNIKKLIVTCALAAAITPAVAADFERDFSNMQPDAKSYGWTPIKVGICSPVALPWGFDWDTFGLDLDFVYSDSNKMYGWQVAGGATVARKDMLGIQTSLLFNMANRDAYGLQVALLNLGNRETYGLTIGAAGWNRDYYGVQINFLSNVTKWEFEGFGAAGLVNVVGEDMWGMQVSLLGNFAKEMHGFQLSGIFNMTEELRGAQVALINYAQTCPGGFQIGLINMIMDNQLPFLPIANCYF